VASLMQRRRVLKQLITYIGLDVHKDTIAVALAEAGLRGEVREYGKIANTPIAVKLAQDLLAEHWNADDLTEEVHHRSGRDNPLR
jgi:hypothetical protein